MLNQFKRYFRLRRLLRCIRFAWTDPVFSNKIPFNTGQKHLLLIKTEAIGDYILFRNFLKEIRESDQYKGWHISLLGNEVWQALALSLDKNEFDQGIFINRKRFQEEGIYRRKILQDLSAICYDEAVNCTFSREFLLGDSIIHAVPALLKTGMKGDTASEIPFVKWIADRYYSNLIDIGNESLFEFDKNRQFFESLLHQKSDLSVPKINLSQQRKPYALLFPGAQDKIRQWPAASFASIAAYIHDRYQYEIIISGSMSDVEVANRMINESNSTYLKDQTGKHTLAELPNLIAAASLVVCNDSGSLHLAAAVGTPCVCISNGNHYGRFTPYPVHKELSLAFLYPPAFLQENTHFKSRVNAVRYGSDYKIDTIEVAQVEKSIERLLNE